MKRIYVDTEFIDTGTLVHPISFGLVDDEGREYYAEVDGAPLHLADDWVKEHVIPKLQRVVTPIVQIRADILTFCGSGEVEFWGSYCAYDWLVLCQLWGKMVDGPKRWPHRINDIAQLAASKGLDEANWPVPFGDPHNALYDALNIRVQHRWMETR
jgi:hypothetical protein